MNHPHAIPVEDARRTRAALDAVKLLSTEALEANVVERAIIAMGTLCLQLRTLRGDIAPDNQAGLDRHRITSTVLADALKLLKGP